MFRKIREKHLENLKILTVFNYKSNIGRFYEYVIT